MPSPCRKIDRRQLLTGALALGAVAGPAADLQAAEPLASGLHPDRARRSLTLSIARDLQGIMAPPYRTGPIENNVLRSVLQGLIVFKPGIFEWEPWAAKRILQVSPTIIAFELYPGLLFHGGYGEMTAADVKFSFELFGRTGPDGAPAPYAKDWEALDHVEVTGRYTGRILLKNPAPELWLIALPDGDGLIMSEKAWADGAYRLDRQPVRVIGTGPYLFSQWHPNQQVVLGANPAYAGPRPAFDEIVLRPVRDPKTAELALRAGELQFAAIEPASAGALSRVPDTTIVSQPSINYVWIGINVEKPPFDDVRVRRAIGLGLDIDELILGAYDGSVGRAEALIAPGLLGHWADAPRYRRDVAGARRLLAEAGHPNGFRTTLTLLNRPVFQNVGVIAQAMLADIGVAVRLEILDSGTFWSRGEGEGGKSIDMAVQRFGGKADPAFQVQWFGTGQIGEWNWQRWSSAVFDRLATEAAGTDDALRRQTLYVEMQELMDRSAAFIWLTHESNIFACRSWVKPAVLPNGDDMNYFQFGRV